MPNNDAERGPLRTPVSVVMPVCNEAPDIERVVEDWARTVFDRLPAGSEHFIDEAASTDGTREILERLKLKHAHLRVVYNDVKDGYAAAARRLYAGARCPLVFMTDSDGEYVAEEFWKLAPLAESHDIVHGTQRGRQSTAFRQLASVVFNMMTRLLLGIRSRDINAAFRFIRKDVVMPLLPKLRTMRTLLNAELLIRAELAGYSIAQVPVRHGSRTHGTSRSLPARRFLLECLSAYAALVKLAWEYRLRHRSDRNATATSTSRV